MNIEFLWVLVALLNAMMIVSWAVWMAVRATRERMGEVVKEHHRKRDIIRQTLRASSFGLASRHGLQARGLSALVLTAKEFSIIGGISGKAFEIPLDKVTVVTKTKSHAGKACHRDLLKVEFTGEKGTDSIAVLVEDLDDWIKAINEARAKVLGNPGAEAFAALGILG